MAAEPRVSILRASAGTLIGAVALALAACERGPIRVSESGFGAYEVSGNGEIYVRFVDGSGRGVRPEMRLTATPAQSYEADIAALGDGFAVAWYEKAADGRLDARLARFTRDGDTVWETGLAVGEGPSRNPVLRVRGDELFCAWIERAADGLEYVLGGWFTRDGEPREPAVPLGPANATTWNLNAAVDERGRAFVAYDARIGTDAEELHLAVLDAGHVELERLTGDDGHRSKYPDIALRGETAAVTWFDERDGNREVYLAVGALETLRRDVETRARRITENTGRSIGAYIAWNGPRLGLAWSDDTSGNYEVLFLPFDAAGEPLAPARQITRTPASSLIPAIRAWRDGFVLAWNEVERGAHGAHDPDARSEVMVTFVR
jgi:hypothetical protein